MNTSFDLVCYAQNNILDAGIAMDYEADDLKSIGSIIANRFLAASAIVMFPALLASVFRSTTES